MALGHSPSIVMDGLVFGIDAANSRSYAGSGLTVNGLSGGIGATLVNGVGFSSAGSGSFTLDGTNDYIFAPIDTNLFSTEATMIIWLKNNNANASLGFLGYNQSSANDHYPWVDGLAYLSTFRNGRLGPITLSSAINRALPHMVSITTNSSSWNLYQNGTLQYTTSSAGSVYLSKFTIGFSTDLWYYGGEVYAFMIYNRALSAQEIQQNYNATKGRYI